MALKRWILSTVSLVGLLVPSCRMGFKNLRKETSAVTETQKSLMEDFCAQDEAEPGDLLAMEQSWSDEDWDIYLALVEENKLTPTDSFCNSQDLSRVAGINPSVLGKIFRVIFKKSGAGGVIQLQKQTGTVLKTIARKATPDITVYLDIDSTLFTNIKGGIELAGGGPEFLASLSASKIKLGIFSDSSLSRIQSVVSDLTVSLRNIKFSGLSFFPKSRIFSDSNVAVNAGLRKKVFQKNAEQMKNIVLIDDAEDILNSNQAMSHFKINFSIKSNMSLSESREEYLKLKNALNAGISNEKKERCLKVMRDNYEAQNRLVMVRGAIDEAVRISSSNKIPFNEAMASIGRRISGLDTAVRKASYDEMIAKGLGVIRKTFPEFTLPIP